MPKQAPALPPEEAEGPFTIDMTPSVLPPKMRAASPADGVAGMLADAPPGASSNITIANEPDAALKPGNATTLKLMLEISHEAALVSVLKKLVHFVNFVELEGGKSAGEARLKAEAKAMIERLQQAGAPVPSQAAAVEERRSSQCSQVLDEASVLKRRVSTASDDGAADADATGGLRRLDSKKILDVDHNTLESELNKWKGKVRRRSVDARAPLPGAVAGGRRHGWRHSLSRVLDGRSSRSRAARLVQRFLFGTVLVTIANTTLETDDGLHHAAGGGCAWGARDAAVCAPTFAFFIIALLCNGIFTLEFVLRLLVAPSVGRFCRSARTLEDVLAFVPLYIELAFWATTPGVGHVT